MINFSHLNLCRNRLKDLGVSLIMDALVRTKSTVVHIDYSQNELSQQGTMTIFQKLANLPNIVSIELSNLDGQHRNKVGLKSIQALADILKDPQTMLTHIKIGGNFIGNKGLKMLMEGLTFGNGNERVMELDLSNNELTGNEAGVYLS